MNGLIQNQLTLSESVELMKENVIPPNGVAQEEKNPLILNGVVGILTMLMIVPQSLIWKTHSVL